MQILLNALIKQVIYYHWQVGQPRKNGDAPKEAWLAKKKLNYCRLD